MFSQLENTRQYIIDQLQPFAEKSLWEKWIEPNPIRDFTAVLIKNLSNSYHIKAIKQHLINAASNLKTLQDLNIEEYKILRTKLYTLQTQIDIVKPPQLNYKHQKSSGYSLLKLNIKENIPNHPDYIEAHQFWDPVKNLYSIDWLNIMHLSPAYYIFFKNSDKHIIYKSSRNHLYKELPLKGLCMHSWLSACGQYLIAVSADDNDINTTNLYFYNLNSNTKIEQKIKSKKTRITRIETVAFIKEEYKVILADSLNKTIYIWYPMANDFLLFYPYNRGLHKFIACSVNCHFICIHDEYMKEVNIIFSEDGLNNFRIIKKFTVNDNELLNCDFNAAFSFDERYFMLIGNNKLEIYQYTGQTFKHINTLALLTDNNNFPKKEMHYRLIPTSHHIYVHIMTEDYQILQLPCDTLFSEPTFSDKFNMLQPLADVSIEFKPGL